VILDNPVHERGELDYNVWLDAMKLLKPTIAIIPDVIDEPDRTIGLARQTQAMFADRDTGTQLMAVPHGETHDDFIDCAYALSRLPAIRYLGVSLERRLRDDPEALNRRRLRIKLIAASSNLDHFKIHLLGISEQSTEFDGSDIWKRVESCDTSKFAVFHLINYPVEPPVPITQPYPGRQVFGGSMQYFKTRGHLGLSDRRSFSDNMQQWYDYANRGN
jgi:hypothetical protein